MVGCFGFNGPLRQYFSLYRAVSQREGEREERIDESKNVQILYSSAPKKKIISEIKDLTFSLAGLQVVSSSAFISYVLQVQVLPRLVGWLVVLGLMAL